MESIGESTLAERLAPNNCQLGFTSIEVPRSDLGHLLFESAGLLVAQRIGGSRRERFLFADRIHFDLVLIIRFALVRFIRIKRLTLEA